MIKVNYNISGKIMGFYPDSIKYLSVPEPFVEIDEDEYNEVFQNLSKYKVVEGKITDISDTEDYLYEKNIYEKAREVSAIKQEIINIELSQHRAIREHILNPTEDSAKRISDIEERISLLRTQMNSIQI